MRALSDIAQIIVADITSQTSIAQMAGDILTSAPERFALAGFSLGSQVALEIMEQANERVERLALLSATHGGLTPVVEGALEKAIRTLNKDTFDAYLEQAYPTYVAPGRANDIELKRIFMGMAHEVGLEAGRRQMKALLGITHPFANLGEIRCPTVLIGGNDDRRTPPAAHEMLAAEIPRSELVVVKDSGHFTPLEQPAAVTDALQSWLTR